MCAAPIYNARKRVVTIVLTLTTTPRHTVTTRQSTRIIGEGAWLRNSR
jgi:hypothetical protein